MTFCDMCPCVDEALLQVTDVASFPLQLFKSKLSKSEGTRKVEYACTIFKVYWCCLCKIMKISPCLSNCNLQKLESFFETHCSTYNMVAFNACYVCLMCVGMSVACVFRSWIQWNAVRSNKQAVKAPVKCDWTRLVKMSRSTSHWCRKHSPTPR